MKRARAESMSTATATHAYTVLLYVIPTRDVLCVPFASAEAYQRVSQILALLPPSGRLLALQRATSIVSDYEPELDEDVTTIHFDQQVVAADPAKAPVVDVDLEQESCHSETAIARHTRQLTMALRQAVAPGHAWHWTNLLKSMVSLECQLVHVV